MRCRREIMGYSMQLPAEKAPDADSQMQMQDGQAERSCALGTGVGRN
jgi:hypothetical protein